MGKIITKAKNIFLSEYFILAVILVLGFSVRLYKIGNPIADWHSWRQSDTASVTKIYLDKGIDVLHPRYQDISSIQTGIANPEGYRMVELPIFNVVHAQAVLRFPQLSLELWGRLISVFSWAAATIFIFLLGRKFIGKWGGALSAFFFSFLPFNIYFTRVILPEPMAVAFVAASLWFFSEFIDRDSVWHLILSGIFFSLAMLIKPFVGFYLVAMGYLAIKKYGLREIFANGRLLIKALVFANLILVPFFAWRARINQYPQGIPFFEWAFNGDKIRFRPAFWNWIYGERFGRLILGGWGLIPLAFGLFGKKLKDNFMFYLGLAIIAYVSVVATASVRHDYYQILAMPVFALILGQGARLMWNQEINHYAWRMLLVFSVGIMFITGWTQVKEFYKINHPEIIEAGREVDKIAPKDALVIAPYNGDTAFLYQTGRSGWPAVDTSIDEIIKKGAGYYVSVNFADPDTKDVMVRYRTIKKTGTYIIIDLTKGAGKTK